MKSVILLLLCLLSISLRAAEPAHRDIVYGEAGKQKQLLDVWFPAAHVPGENVKKPAVLCVHGGAWRGGNKNDMAGVAAELAKAGYVTFSIGYRLFDPAKHPENVWPAQLDDVQRAVRWVRHHAADYGVDPDRLGAIGMSAGGHLVALLGTCDTRDNSDAVLAPFSSRVNAVVNVVGPVDFRGDFSHLTLAPGMTVQQAIDDFLGTVKLDPAARAKIVEAASPQLQADAKTVPMLLVHGALDPLVPVDQARKFHAALEKLKRPAELLIFPDEGHGFGKPVNQLKFRTETARFLAAHLKAASAAEVDKKENQ